MHVGAALAAVVVLALAAVVAVGVALKHTGSSVPQAGQAIGYTAPPPDKHLYALWIGDSYTAGTGAGTAASGYPYLTDAVFGLATGLDAQGGTGFYNNGQENNKTFAPLPDRLATDKTRFPTPQFIVIDSGRNDGPLLSDKLRGIDTTYFTELAATYPGVHVVLLVPFYISSKPTAFSIIGTFMTQQAAQHGWSVIDPETEGWIGDAPSDLVWTDKVHPNQAGHAYVAEHVAADLQRLNLATPTATVTAS